MRKDYIFTMIAILFFYLSFSLLTANPFSDAVSVDTISPSQTVIHFTLPDFELTEYIYQNTSYAQIEMDGAFAGAEAGLPDLPHFSATLAIPIGSTPTFAEVTLSTPRYMQTLPIAPVQNTDAQDYSFDIDTQFYQSKDQKVTYPQTSYFMSEIQTLRDYQFITVKIYPIKYIPAEKTIEIIDSFHFTVNHLTSSPNPVYTLRPFISRPFEKIYEHTFQNYHQVRSPNPAYQEQSILLIYGGENPAHTPTFQSYLNNIVNLKRQKGFLVTVESTLNIGTTTTDIKSYIQDLYDNSMSPPEWIILLGNVIDSYIIPHYTTTFIGYPGSSDYPYTHLAGNDLIGDAFIGRISANNENALSNYWQKIQKYELNTPATTPSLYKKTLLVGHSAVSGISTYIINRYIKSLIVDFDPTANIQEMYYSDSQTSNVRNNFNTGHNIFNFRGSSGMDNFTVNSLTNTNILTNTLLLTCATGNFLNGITQQMIAHSFNGSPAGAILAIGIHTVHTETEYNNAMNGGIFYAMYVMDVSTMGEALLYGKIYTTVVYPGLGHTDATTHWTNLMGDPSLYYFKTTPKIFATALPATISVGAQSIRFVITDTEGNNVPSAWVTISNNNGSYISKAISDADGIAYLPLNHELTGSFMLAISKPGFHVKRSPATVTGNPTISVIDRVIYDHAPGGNSSQTINPGETINLSIKVKNFTTSNATNLSATVSTESDFVTLVGATTATLGSIGAGLEVLYNDAFTFEVSPLAPDKDLLPFTFVISDGSTIWTSYLLLEVNGIDLKVTSINPTYLNIGSGTNLTFSIKNVGTIPSGTLQAELIPRSHYLTVNTIVNIPNIAVGATVIHSPSFSVYASNSSIAGMTLKANLHIYNATGFDVNIPINLPAGNKVVGDPTGPDDYGYVIYHSSDTDTTVRPVYNWINIANIGTNTGMSDISADQEEDKRLIMLPFLAGFYGQLYDRITICSNGWMTFGETEQKDFRNLPLPGPIAPHPIIAPYWTDLVMGSSFGGGVYTYHSQEEQAFIVQFDKVKWVTAYWGGSDFYTSSDSVSFQVLIYDPMYNATALGDSKIKLQYRRFNPGMSGDSDNPSQYITVGIQDRTAQTGLQYTFNNTYSPGSNILSDGSALLITSINTAPLIYVNIEQIDIEFSEVNNTYTTPFTIENLGSATLVGTITLPDFCSIDCDIDFTILPHSTQDILLSFLSSEPGTYSDNIAIFSNADNNPEIYLPINAYVDLGVDPYFVFTGAVNPVTDTNAIDYGSQVNIITTVQNLSSVVAENVTFTLSTSSEYIQMDVAERIVTFIDGTTSYTMSEPFSILVSETVVDQTIVPFTLTISTQNRSWEMDFTMVVNAPKLLMMGLILRDSAGLEVSNFSPGDEGSLSISFRNIGHLPMQNGTMYITAISPTLHLATSEETITTLPINGFYFFSTDILIDSNIPQNTLLSAIYAFISRNQALIERVNITIGQVVESFETGNLTAFPWTVETERPWTVVTSNHYHGQYGAQSSLYTAHNQSSTLQIDWPTSSAGIIEFAYKTSTEYNGDFLRFYINDTLMGQWSGPLIDSGWATVSYPVPALTTNNFKWRYEKNATLVSGQDRVWIDNIRFPVRGGESFSNVPLAIVSLNAINFLNVDVGSEVSTTFTMRNLGSVALVGNISLPEHFSVDSEPSFAIQPLSVSQYSVSFSCEVSGEYNGVLAITSNDLIHPVINIPLRAVVRPTSELDLTAIPTITVLKTNYPNPFNPSTNIAFDIAHEGLVSIEVYNIKGQRVKTLVNSVYDAGSHTTVWNGDDSFGRPVSSGVYFYRMTAEGYVSVKKMLMMK